MLAALQQTSETVAPAPPLAHLRHHAPTHAGAAQPVFAAERPTGPSCAEAPRPRQFTIQGVTKDGRTFRPSDWSERLAGALSAFRPAGSAAGIGAHIGYSPYCVPRVIDGIKCVIVSEALRAVELMAWDFVMHFARDNELAVSEVLSAAPLR